MYKFIFIFSIWGMTGCTALFFQPMGNHLYSPTDLELDYQNLYFPSLDGTRLHGWWLPARGKAIGSVLFLHGNAENISTHIGSIGMLPEQGFNVFLFDYRGYGRSDGTAYLEGLLMDVEAGLGQLLIHDETEKLAVFGQSLGAALAILGVAGSPYKDKISVVVADSSFTGFRDIAQEKLSSHWLTWLFQWPIAMTINNSHRPIDEISNLYPSTVILVHSESDQVIPFHHSEALYNAAREPKSLWKVSNFRHNQIFARADNQIELAKRLKSGFK